MVKGIQYGWEPIGAEVKKGRTELRMSGWFWVSSESRWRTSSPSAQKAVASHMDSELSADSVLDSPWVLGQLVPGLRVLLPLLHHFPVGLLFLLPPFLPLEEPKLGGWRGGCEEMKWRNSDVCKVTFPSQCSLPYLPQGQDDESQQEEPSQGTANYDPCGNTVILLFSNLQNYLRRQGKEGTPKGNQGLTGFNSVCASVTGIKHHFETIFYMPCKEFIPQSL